MTTIPAPLATDHGPATLPLLQRVRPTLAQVLAPAGVAVVGAGDPQGIGRVLLANLVAGGFTGVITPVDPRLASIHGLAAVTSLGACPRPPDLVLAAIPLAEVPALVADAIRAGVAGIVLAPATAGDHDLAPDAACRAALRTAREAGMVVLGPDSLGVMNPWARLHAAFNVAMPQPGHLAVVGQSGGLLATLVEHACLQGMGLSGVVALGTMGGTGWEEALDHFAEDPQTRAIILAIEDLGDPGRFLGAAREVAALKPVIALKARRATFRHPAQEPSSFTTDEVLDGFFAHAGVLRVNGLTDLFAIAGLLATHTRPAGRRLAVVSCTHGVGLLAAEAIVRDGGEVTGPRTAEPVAGRGAVDGDPVRLIARDGADLGAVAEAALNDPRCDGVLVVLTPSGVGHPARAAQDLAALREATSKPVLASWMGGPSMAAGRAVLARAGIPLFGQPDLAARAWNALGRHADLMTALYDRPAPVLDDGHVVADRAAAAALLDRQHAAGGRDLAGDGALRLLRAHHLPVALAEPAETLDGAVALAATSGYPVEIEELPAGAHHDQPGAPAARLTVGDDRSLRVAFHAIRLERQAVHGAEGFAGVAVRPAGGAHAGRRMAVTLALDERFGPVIGIRAQEPGNGRAGWTCGLPPLSATHARRMLARAGLAADRREPGTAHAAPGDAPLERLLMACGGLAIDHPRIRSAELEVVLNRWGGPLVLAARFAFHDPLLADGQLPRPLSRCYPAAYVSRLVLDDGTVLTVRPIVPADEAALVLLHGRLSERSVHYRYFHGLPLAQRIAHGRLSRICHADYARQIALVVVRGIPGVGEELLAVGRLNRLRDREQAELALLVTDTWQRHGIGGHLLRLLLDVARHEGLRQLVAAYLPANQAMGRLLVRHGFDLLPGGTDGEPVTARRAV